MWLVGWLVVGRAQFPINEQSKAPASGWLPACAYRPPYARYYGARPRSRCCLLVVGSRVVPSWSTFATQGRPRQTPSLAPRASPVQTRSPRYSSGNRSTCRRRHHRHQPTTMSSQSFHVVASASPLSISLSTYKIQKCASFRADNCSCSTEQRQSLLERILRMIEYEKFLNDHKARRRGRGP